MGIPTPPCPKNNTGNHPEKDFRGATAKAGAPFLSIRKLLLLEQRCMNMPAKWRARKADDAGLEEINIKTFFSDIIVKFIIFI